MYALFPPCSYNRDSEELTKWLDSAQQRMNFWKEQSLNASQDLPTIRDNISSFFVSISPHTFSYKTFQLPVRNGPFKWLLVLL